MSDKRNDQFVDELLDAALAQYSRTEPQAGLEARLRQRLEEEQARPARAGWIWIPVAATAAVVLGVTVLYVSRRAPAEQESQPRVARVAPGEAPAPVPPLAAPPAAGRRTAAAQPPRLGAPRLEQFPAPAPLSEEERLLLRYAQQARAEQVVAARLGAGKLAELSIEPLRIPPLSSEPN